MSIQPDHGMNESEITSHGAVGDRAHALHSALGPMVLKFVVGPNHKEGCDGSKFTHSGSGYNCVRVCSCGAEDQVTPVVALETLSADLALARQDIFNLALSTATLCKDLAELRAELATLREANAKLNNAPGSVPVAPVNYAAIVVTAAVHYAETYTKVGTTHEANVANTKARGALFNAVEEMLEAQASETKRAESSYV